MISIDEARKIQRERSKKALSRFNLFDNRHSCDFFVFSAVGKVRHKIFLCYRIRNTDYFRATAFTPLLKILI